MNKLQHYCPKCGEQLTPHAKGHMQLYHCTNPQCNYINNITSDTIDISFKSKGLAKALSNLCPYPFEFDGVRCSSMESFIQSLKVQDICIQEDVCSKTGPFCYSIREMFDDWRKTQTVYWKGQAIGRHTQDYINLLKRAYKALYQQSPIFREAIKKSKDYHLIHSIGCKNSKETLLTPDEFMNLLYELRDNI